MLSSRALNRALLARQLLLQRRKLPVATVLERLVGLQAQAPQTPYVGLWSRIEGFQPDALSRLISTRKALRIAMMRSTIHLVTEDDCLELRPVVQSVLERSLKGTFGRRLADVNLGNVAAAGRILVEERPRTLGEIGTVLTHRWPGGDPSALANAVRALVPLVQVPPRGLWRGSGQALHTSAEAWLGRPLASSPAPDTMILRYLAAFGPASIKDAQVWSGLTRLAETFERLRPKLRTFEDEHGVELFDVVNGPQPDPDTSVPPRFLPEYDNVFLSHADRTRIVSDTHRTRMVAENVLASWLLVDGFLAGTWKITCGKDVATLTIDPFAKLSKQEKNAVTEEGTKLLAFMTPETKNHGVRFGARPA